jgi:hypothetical protein
VPIPDKLIAKEEVANEVLLGEEILEDEERRSDVTVGV